VIKIFVMTSISALLITLIFILASPKLLHAHGKEEQSGKVSKEEITYTANIAPLFKKRCAKCHGPKSPVHMEFVKDVKKYKKKMKGPRMDSYTYLVSFIVWPDTGSLMRALDDGENTENSRPGRMYKYLGKTDEEKRQNLKLFRDWVGNWTLNEWSEIQKDEINKLKLSY
jgi:hypothetical protein